MLDAAATSVGKSVAALSRERPQMLVFLRHSGCTFCREAMADLAACRAGLEAMGTGLVLVHMASPESFSSFARAYGLADVPAISDPDRRLYAGLGLRRGSMRQLLGWRVWWRGFRAFIAGHGVGKWEGDVAQLPGVFVVRNGQVMHRYEHATSADRPDYVALAGKWAREAAGHLPVA